MGARIKCNPAIKTDKDRRALRKALREGLIDVIGSDHAPHLLSEKNGDALTATSGCPNMQMSLPMLMDLASEKVFKIETVAEKTAHAPARIFGIERRGFIREGYYADLALVRATEPYEVTDSMSLSKCGWLPIAGETLHHVVDKTWVNGCLAYDNGSVNTGVRGQALHFSAK
jgi:dihydroorotase